MQQDPDHIERYARRLAMALQDGHFARCHSIVDEAEIAATATPDEITLDTSLAAVGLPVRIVNLLERAGVHSVRDCLQRTPAQLAEIPNCGSDTIKTIIATLRALPIHVGVSVDDV